MVILVYFYCQNCNLDQEKMYYCHICIVEISNCISITFWKNLTDIVLFINMLKVYQHRMHLL